MISIIMMKVKYNQDLINCNGWVIKMRACLDCEWKKATVPCLNDEAADAVLNYI